MKETTFDMFPCLYTATIYESYDQTQHKPILVKESGIIFATSFCHAMKQIEDYYKDILCSVELELFEEGCVYVPQSKVQEIRKLLEDKYEEDEE